MPLYIERFFLWSLSNDTWSTDTPQFKRCVNLFFRHSFSVLHLLTHLPNSWWTTTFLPATQKLTSVILAGERSKSTNYSDIILAFGWHKGVNLDPALIKARKETDSNNLQEELRNAGLQRPLLEHSTYRIAQTGRATFLLDSDITLVIVCEQTSRTSRQNLLNCINGISRKFIKHRNECIIGVPEKGECRCKRAWAKLFTYFRAVKMD